MYSFVTENGNCNICGANAIFSCKTCANLCPSCQNACAHNDHDKSRHIDEVINYTSFENKEFLCLCVLNKQHILCTIMSMHVIIALLFSVPH